MLSALPFSFRIAYRIISFRLFSGPFSWFSFFVPLVLFIPFPRRSLFDLFRLDVQCYSCISYRSCEKQTFKNIFGQAAFHCLSSLFPLSFSLFCVFPFTSVFRPPCFYPMALLGPTPRRVPSAVALVALSATAPSPSPSCGHRSSPGSSPCLPLFLLLFSRFMSVFVPRRLCLVCLPGCIQVQRRVYFLI